MTAPSRVRMHVLEVRCRHCGQKVDVEIPVGDEKEFGQKLAEVEQLAAKGHTCAPKGDPST